MQTTATPAEVAGKGLGGLLVQVFGAPFALLADAAGYMLAALSLSAIRTTEPAPEPPRQTNLRAQIGEGLRLVLGHPILRILSSFTVLVSFALSGYYALVMVFLSRTVGLPASLIGVLIALGSLGGLLGAITANPLGRRIGSARWLRTSTAICFPCGLLIPLTQQGWAVAWYIIGAALVTAGVTSYNIMAVSYTQAVCPNDLLGRVHSVIRVFILGAAAAGSITSGALGSWLGIRPALWIILAVLLTVPLALVATPLRRHRDLPTDTPFPGTPRSS